MALYAGGLGSVSGIVDRGTHPRCSSISVSFALSSGLSTIDLSLKGRTLVSSCVLSRCLLLTVSKSPAPPAPNDAWPLELGTGTKGALDLVRGISESRYPDGIKEPKVSWEKGASCVAYSSGGTGAVEEAKSVNMNPPNSVMSGEMIVLLLVLHRLQYSSNRTSNTREAMPATTIPAIGPVLSLTELGPLRLGELVGLVGLVGLVELVGLVVGSGGVGTDEGVWEA